MRVLVTGANGQLGSEFKQLAEESAYKFVFCDIEEMDLSNKDSIIDFLNKNPVDFIISAGAYTNVDGAENDVELAKLVNGVAPGIIAEFCRKNSTRLIHISTDYVFDGEFSTPIKEEATPNPKSVYGVTKLLGEKAITQSLDNYYIIRTSWVYSNFGKNFVRTMLRLGAEKEQLAVVCDQIGTPTYAGDLASMILNIVKEVNSGNDQPGIYNFSNEGVCSWYDFASEIMKLSELGCKVIPVNSDQFPTVAARPNFSVLDKSKIKKQFNIKIEHWSDRLLTCLEKIKNN
ncbi:MAG: dTDP-4-dehydrorhamnose reductase [Bacteroidota bacterium]